MLRHSTRGLSAAVTASPPLPPAAPSSGSPARADPPVAFRDRVHAFVGLLETNQARYDGVALALDASSSRGLVAKRKFREGMTVLSVPMQHLALSATNLLERSPHLRAMSAPTYNDVRRHMTLHSVRDPVIYQQVHLALLLAAERMNAASAVTSYFDVLPHPAIDDAAVLGLHKDVVDPMQLLEWEQYQREFLVSLRELLRMWGPGSPPIEVAYWALRTVLSRMHMLPDRGLAPAEVGSSLNYSALSSFELLEVQTRFVKRLRRSFTTLFTSRKEEEEYRLVPTLVPLLDMTNHIPSSNVSVEVQARPGRGSCVELQAITQIDEGEQIGLRFNRTHSQAFALYRFGFLPQ